MSNKFPKIKNFWHQTNIATKFLLLIGFLSLIQISLTVFFNYNDSSPAIITVRSIASNIFGFIFGDQSVDNSNIASKYTQTFIAAMAALICMIIVIVSHWYNINQSNASLIEIRNILFASIGFLISRAKNSEDQN